MDLQDLQDDRRSDLLLGEITEKIIGCAFEVIKELGTGFLESVYEKAMSIALQEKGFRVQCQQPLQVHFRQRIVGSPATNESINELRPSCTSCPSMFIH